MFIETLEHTVSKCVVLLYYHNKLKNDLVRQYKFSLVFEETSDTRVFATIAYLYHVQSLGTEFHRPIFLSSVYYIDGPILSAKFY